MQNGEENIKKRRGAPYSSDLGRAMTPKERRQKQRKKLKMVKEEGKQRIDTMIFRRFGVVINIKIT